MMAVSIGKYCQFINSIYETVGEYKHLNPHLKLLGTVPMPPTLNFPAMPAGLSVDLI